jgi:phosphoglycerate dehydrogenase-like enzyme
LTPHIGASSKEKLLRIGDETIAIIEEFMKGDKDIKGDKEK